MAVAVTHTFVSPVADDSDPNEVGPNEWNDTHTVTGLGTAAEANTTDFATAAQGATADTAVQPGDLATVATTGAYSDLSGLPTLHDAVTVTDSSEINFTLTGQDITASLIAGSIDESKLDVSVNASLDLADSALQASAIGVSVQAYDADLTSWASVTRASGFDTFVATPSSANLRALLSDEAGTGAAYFVGGALGTPASGVATNLTGTASGLTAGNVTTNANLTGPITSVGNATSIASQTGTGTTFAMSAGPTFTGVPAAPTAAVDTNTTQIATTAMVLAQAAAATPLGNAATAVVGTSTRFARADHVHPGREVLTAARTYYVRTDGSDSNTGLVDSSGGAFLTIQKAIDVVAALDISIYTVTIQVRDGTFSGNIRVAGPWVGTGTVNLTGNTSTPANCVITSSVTVQVTNGGRLNINGFEVQASSIGLSAIYNGRIAIGANMRFGACTNYHWEANFGGIVVGNNYAIVGAAALHMRIDGGFGQFAANTPTLSGTLAFTIFAEVTGTGALSHFSTTWTGGTITGTRYSANLNGVINTFGGGASVFPGNVAGSTATGGQYA